MTKRMTRAERSLVAARTNLENRRDVLAERHREINAEIERIDAALDALKKAE